MITCTRYSDRIGGRGPASLNHEHGDVFASCHVYLQLVLPEPSRLWGGVLDGVVEHWSWVFPATEQIIPVHVNVILQGSGDGGGERELVGGGEEIDEVNDPIE